MGTLRKSLKEDERGVEPTVMKILVGVILVTIGLGIGVTVYRRFGGAAESYLNYSVTVTPSSDTIQKGNTGSVQVDVDTNVDFDEEVTITATGVPDNVTVSFNPSTGTPSFGSTMNIIVGDNADSITQTITVKAAADGNEKSATYELTIE